MMAAARSVVRKTRYGLSIAGRGNDKTAGMAAHRHAIILYSEGRQYFSSFKPLLDELNQRQLSFSFLTSDPDDPGLDLAAAGATSRYIGAGPRAWAILNTLEADIVIMTTPRLDVMQIKRSKDVRHYCHIVHSPTDKALSRPFSFDYFDSLIVCGPHQTRTIRFLENLRGTAVKEIYQCGLAYYDFMADRLSQVARSRPVSVDRPLRILVAPTWGQNGLLRRYGARIFQPFLKAGLSVTIRPHPQSIISEPDVIEAVRRGLVPHSDVIWDFGADPIDAMVWSDALLSDISGIIFDYVFLFEKPVMTAAFTVDKRGTEAADLPYMPWELAALDDISHRVAETDFESLPQIAASLCGKTWHGQKVHTLRERNVVRFGDAAPAIVDAIEEILHRGATGPIAGPQRVLPKHSRSGSRS